MYFDAKLASDVAQNIQRSWGIATGTQILTAKGAVDVESLKAGDRIITRDAGMVAVARVEIETIECDAIRIRAGSLGHDRPEQDTLLPAGQKLLIRDWRSKAMTGKAQALMTAAALVDGEFLKKVEDARLQVIRLYFDQPRIVYADGLELHCPAA
ncbi:Hint domain-containing protein [Donghicola tyrosinivorans]|uniref:Hint domain-containing protein n=1 Tax=Donghicola tyrosinivorans TaxID=1652492 RepID=A0A2T0WTZ6_9RHOB|nr:Hint domain-containing protein [Donghicola tyrosinivorans]PRY90173.1 Hint domain-containing protein [Donghicola tyrosinivorans]